MRLAILLVLVVTALSAQTVEGRVVNELTGAPVAGVTVTLFSGRGGLLQGEPLRARTGDDGRFKIEAVPDGLYTPRYTATGYFDIPGPSAPRPSIAVTTLAKDPVHLEVKMLPTSKISGRILDSEGKPVALADVWLLWSDRWCKPPACLPAIKQVRAWTDGTYNVNDLPMPGAWLLAASAPDNWPVPPPRDDQAMALTQTFYPNTTDPQLAEPIVVRPGAQLWNVDIKLNAVRAYHVRGRILDPQGKPAPRAEVGLAKGFGPQITVQAQVDGSFEFPSVTEAEWRLSASLEKGSGSDKVKLWAAQWIEVRRGDLEAPDLRLNTPFALDGKVIFQAPDGAPAPPTPRLDFVMLLTSYAVLSDMRGAFIPGMVDDGDLTFRDVYPGTYKVEAIGDSPAPYYLDSIRLGTRDATGNDVPILSAADPLTLTYKLGGGTVGGTVEACGGANVVLVPQDPALRRAGFMRVAPCDAKGKFAFDAVRPGDYYAFGTTRTGLILAYTADLSATERLKQAARVTVRDHESTTVEVRLVY